LEHNGDFTADIAIKETPTTKIRRLYSSFSTQEKRWKPQAASHGQSVSSTQAF
jgi:hypothetical protein